MSTNEPQAMNTSEERREAPGLPEDMLIILPVRNMVLFPGVVLPVAIKREQTVAGAQEAVRTDSKVGFLLQKDPGTDEPGFDDLRRVGTAASILRYITAPDGTHHLVCQGERRFRVIDRVEGFPYLVARVEYLSDSGAAHPEVEARSLLLKEKAAEAISLLPQAPAELANSLQAMESPSALADTIASFLDVKPSEKQQILETLELRERLERVADHLTRRVEVLRLSRHIEQQTKEAIDDRQKEILLREQMRQIQKELGEDAGAAEEIGELREAVEKAGMPEEVKEHAEKELKRLERMNEASGEYSMARTYLDTLLAMPWSKLDEEVIDIERAREILDEDHYGLAKIKKRILEYLAVRKLNPEGRSPILCFVGPPGVGKTSLGQSIARALGLKFQRVSLGGVHDEAEIRGHRRTYIGALPGNVVQALRKAGTRNPVMMLDEIDKLGRGIQGDPASALLEVLDPEQNSTFRDNYLGVPFDLSKVLFIATANQLDTIPGPLRDRMEIIELTGYTEEEKVEIARRYLVRRQLAANGLEPGQAAFSDEALARMARDYTREAGCRNLERQIAAVLRNIAVRIAEGKETSVHVDVDDVPEILGAPRFENEVAMRVSVPGVATGLAWTPVGGDILFVEATRVPGAGKLILTGQLGDVMKESAQAALSLVKAQSVDLGIDPSLFEKSDIHVHVPAGAIPKDGPSAGVALYTALVSLLTGRTVRNDVAMTGEVSLRGLVLPVGGIKEKTVAARRAGIRKVLLPARNRKDLEEIPDSVQGDLQFVWLERVQDATEAAFEPPPGEQSHRLAPTGT
ncbi:MAG TPA: endopeptidase La [Steroidobacteraceae bacterium]|nr:endopeptidase La [Steroidobacteraceae bacterium]